MAEAVAKAANTVESFSYISVPTPRCLRFPPPKTKGKKKKQTSSKQICEFSVESLGIKDADFIFPTNARNKSLRGMQKIIEQEAVDTQDTQNQVYESFERRIKDMKAHR